MFISKRAAKMFGTMNEKTKTVSEFLYFTEEIHLQ